MTALARLLRDTEVFLAGERYGKVSFARTHLFYDPGDSNMALDNI